VSPSEDDFVAARSPDWTELESLLERRRRLKRILPSQIARSAALYRSLCSDLMRARGAGYGRELIAYLDGLASRGHNALYAAPPQRRGVVRALLTLGFPRTLRRRARFLLLATLLFLVPGAIGVVGGLRSPEFSARVLSEGMLAEMEASYSKSMSTGRDVDTNETMAGFYVWNNIGIAFRCFATGILLGLGSVFFLIYNGLVIGTVFGAMARAHHIHNLLTFTCGHSPFELTAIVIAGAAGLQMGFAIVSTGGLTRLGSLRAQAPELARLVLGAAVMLAIAAAIEGFWSPSSAPDAVKWVVAIVNCLAVTAYFVFMGRSGREPA
jgi:uncharacterized membrane protein SpoIIM required for sporulation